MGRKPDDTDALPLYHGCHMRQHAFGDEAAWFAAHGIKAPKKLAAKLYAQYRRENPDAPPPYTRKIRSIKDRKPREQRQKIKSRNTFTKRNAFPKSRHFGG